jgi:hypothetical protein
VKTKYIFGGIAFLFVFIISWSVIGPVIFDNYVVQDDFRQSCFWFWRFWDPELFKNDFFTPMYETLAVRSPFFYLLYRIAPFFTDNLILYSKSIVLVLGLLSGFSGYLFFLSLLKKIYPSNSQYLNETWSLAFAVILSTAMWCTDHITVGHTRSFMWIGLFTYMYLKQENKNIAANIFSTFLLLISPHAFIQCLVIESMTYLGPILKKDFKSVFTNKAFWIMIFNVFATYVMFGILFKDVQTQGVGTPFTLDEMKALPEFNPGGRHPIFGSNIWDGTWWMNEHWGMGIGYLKISELIIYGAILSAIFIFLSVFKKLEAKPKIKSTVGLVNLLQSQPALLFYSSIFLYTLSQLTYPKLYHPSRYIAIPWLLLGIVTLVLISGRWLLQIAESFSKKHFSKIFIVGILFLAFIFWSHYKNFYHTRFVSISPQVAQSISMLAKNSLIAGHPILPDLNVASIITKRSVFVDYERSMAYTHESNDEIRRRNLVALQMTYAKTQEEFKQLAKANGITHYLAYYAFYSPEYLANPVYMEPYSQALFQLASQNGKNCFVKSYLEKNGTAYLLIDVNSL